MTRFSRASFSAIAPDFFFFFFFDFTDTFAVLHSLLHLRSPHVEAAFVPGPLLYF